MRHTYHKCEESWIGCSICEGGLAACDVCNGSEGALTTDCPGYPLSWAWIDMVYKGAVDFVGGYWVEGPSPASPASVRS